MAIGEFRLCQVAFHVVNEISILEASKHADVVREQASPGNMIEESAEQLTVYEPFNILGSGQKLEAAQPSLWNMVNL